MADTPDGTGLSLEQAAASLLTGGADTQKEESQESEPVAAADDPASTDEPVAEATDEPAEPSTDEDASDESEAAEPAEPVKFRFKLSDGTEVEATPDELSKSYLRQADYTRKTQEIANQRKALEQEAAALREQRAQEIQTLQVAQQVLRQHVPPPPDPAMAQTDPVGYVQAMAAHNAAMQQYQKIAQQQQAVAEQSQAEQAMMLQQHLASRGGCAHRAHPRLERRGEGQGRKGGADRVRQAERLHRRRIGAGVRQSSRGDHAQSHAVRQADGAEAGNRSEGRRCSQVCFPRRFSVWAVEGDGSRALEAATRKNRQR